ncbi:MAG: hypothetical protein P8N31_13835 [Planctomycetota bacterium]|nr:hypothetical protein [Planctomycetota bacterium]MDG2144627.1 hypothetical protein [Planctomycetota bacterium]
MTSPVDHDFAAEFVEPLARSFDWLLSLRDDRGRIICAEHKVEHTGKSANVCILGLELFRATGDRRFADGAVQQAQRLVANLEREGDSPCFTFRPGRHDPFNCSNSVIDGGACSDALGSLAAAAGELELTEAQAHTFALASVRHAQSYLQYAAVDKGIPAQRAWGLTGLVASIPFVEAMAAEAFEQFEGCTPPDQWKRALEDAAERSLDVLRGIQNDDGSFPYHPHSWGPGHPGAADASSFYQSRVTGFVMHAIESKGDDPLSRAHATGLRAGLDFLVGISGPTGVKVGLVEAKPWYWGATYEVASHVFDCHALATGWRVFEDKGYGRAALSSFRSWAQHLEPGGKPKSHLPREGRCPSYQCSVFWASHAAWAGRVIDELAQLAQLEAAGKLGEAHEQTSMTASQVTWYGDCEVARLEGPRHVAWVRGSRPAGNANHGSVHGAGLLRLVRKSASQPDDELVPRERFGSSPLSEWTGRAGRFRLSRGWRAGKDELRFGLWTARVHWRAGRRLDFVLELPRIFRRAVWAYASPMVSSAFCRTTKTAIQGQTVHLESCLAWRDGTPVPGSRMLRSYEMTAAGLQVTDRLQSTGGASGLSYQVPNSADGGPKNLQETATEVSYVLT